MTTTHSTTATPTTATPITATSGTTALERRGRWWVFGSFVFCPCHLPLTLALLASVFGGTSLGVLVSEHAWVAGTVITASWIVGTWYGFRLLRRARNGAACPLPASRVGDAAPSATAPAAPSATH